jgi:Mg2+/citrate symporter
MSCNLKLKMNTIKTFLYKFDIYGRAVASLNVNGKTTHHTLIGGVMGLLVAILVTVFLGQRSQKMVHKRDPSREQVTQGLNLMAKDSPKVKFNDYQYNVGIGAFAVNATRVYDEATNTYEIVRETFNIDFDEIAPLIDIGAY